MRELKAEDVLRIMREEWDRVLCTLSEEVDLVLKARSGDKEANVVSSGLKVRHKNSGLLYTVDSVGPRDVVLTTPEGDNFTVNAQELESDYSLD